ncbi:hypothetical protein G9G63_25985 [Paenibacillus sp. EKM202P]|uniref:hypothetical protein n=1 Tax=unclassified Paenibacillus TaxID=185978 RepID=UPI0013EDC660|nr:MULTISPECIES: hypothetical protein [unclassified Paenibacillus]KAF6558320.1 hypothetical protein G9G63_25985 [Paenibacillus sp. EKM202P]KAF6563252.1 hypothetical protein G9G64_25870 [Paenibacillus sp. EKM207P]
MSSIQFDRAKTSVGLSNFVLFFDDYQDFYKQNILSNAKDTSKLAQKLLDNNPRARSLGAQKTRVSYAVEIFKNKWEKDMLQAVIESNHSEITEEIRNRAQELIRLLNQ